MNQLDAAIEEEKEEVKDPDEGKSLAEILRAKREATDKILDSTKVTQESIEERR
jgi:hypothetical protein